jgi:hypothetical protein
MTTSKTRKPVKGDTVTVVSIWGSGRMYGSLNGLKTNAPAISTRVLRVESWGKIQATFVDTATGDFIKQRGYTEHLHVAFDADGVAELLADVKAELTEKVARELDIARNWLSEFSTASKVDPALVRAHREQVAILEAYSPDTVTVASYTTLRAAI